MDFKALTDAASRDPWFRVLAVLARSSVPDGTAYPDRVRSRRVIMDTESLVGSARSGEVDGVRGASILVREGDVLYAGWLKITADYSLVIFPARSVVSSKSVPVSLLLPRSRWRVENVPGAVEKYVDAVRSYARSGSAPAGNGVAVGADAIAFGSGVSLRAAPTQVVGATLAAWYSTGDDLSGFAASMVAEGFDESLAPIPSPGTSSVARTGSSAVQQGDGCGCLLLLGLLGPLLAATATAITYIT